MSSFSKFEGVDLETSRFTFELTIAGVPVSSRAW